MAFFNTQSIMRTVFSLLLALSFTLACGDDIDELEEAAKGIDNWGGRGGGKAAGAQAAGAGANALDAGAAEDGGEHSP